MLIRSHFTKLNPNETITGMIMKIKVPKIAGKMSAKAAKERLLIKKLSDFML